MLSHGAQHADAHLVRAAEQLEAFLVLRADLAVQVARLVHQLVPLEGGRLVVRLDVRLAVVRQAHQARLHRRVPPACAEVTERVLLQVGERRELRERSRVMGVRGAYTGDVPAQDRARGEAGAALGAVVDADVVVLVPVDLNALQAEGVPTRDGDRVPQRVHAEGTCVWKC